MKPDELRLQELIDARDAWVGRRIAAERGGGLRVRIHALDSELADLVEAIQRHCAASGLPLPENIPPISAPRAEALVIAQSILDRYLRLLSTRRAMRAAANRAGDRARIANIDSKIRADYATIRKHCERSGLQLPPGLRLTGENES